MRDSVYEGQKIELNGIGISEEETPFIRVDLIKFRFFAYLTAEAALRSRWRRMKFEVWNLRVEVGNLVSVGESCKLKTGQGWILCV